MRRSVAYTDCDRNGNSGCKRYAYRDGNSNRNRNGYAYPNGNTHAYTYSDSKGYSDAETSADASPTPVARLQPLNAGTREAIREFLQSGISLRRKFRTQCFGARQCPAAFLANADRKES